MTLYRCANCGNTGAIEPPPVVNPHCVRCNCQMEFAGPHVVTAKLSYFKRSGKWYADGSLEVDGSRPLFELWADIKKLLDSGKWPGLIDGPHDFFVHVDIPDHRHAHPHMIMDAAAFMCPKCHKSLEATTFQDHSSWNALVCPTNCDLS